MARKTIEQLRAERDKLDARIKQEEARAAKAERDARTHALIVFGAFLENRLGGDWKSIDPEELDRWIHGLTPPASVTRPEPLPTADANRAVRAYEKAKREAGKAAGR